jgi:hypothetical protein
MIQETQKSAFHELPVVREVAAELDQTLNIDVGTQHAHSVDLVFHVHRGIHRMPDLCIFPSADREVIRQKLSEYLQA